MTEEEFNGRPAEVPMAKDAEEAEWDKQLDANEAFAVIQLRVRCLEIAVATASKKASPEELIASARAFSRYVLDDYPSSADGKND